MQLYTSFVLKSGYGYEGKKVTTAFAPIGDGESMRQDKKLGQKEGANGTIRDRYCFVVSLLCN